MVRGVSVNGKHRWLLSGAVLLFALALIAYGTWGFWQRYHATHNPRPAIPTEVVTHSTDAPDETPPTNACANYRVADDQPRQIEITSVGISGCIQKVGIDQLGAMAVPTNIHLAGWYVNSPLPGQQGISVIDGHVMGKYSSAIFTNLKNVKAGDQIRIQFGDESWKTFEVADTASYPTDKVMNHVFDPISGASSQLTLITCGGRFDRTSQMYESRIVVRARLLPQEG